MSISPRAQRTPRKASSHQSESRVPGASFTVEALSLWVGIGVGRGSRRRDRVFRLQSDGWGNGGCARGRGLGMSIGGDCAADLTIFLVVVGFDDIADHGTGGFAAMLAAFLNENGDANFRIAPWRVADEPGVVGKLRAFVH